MCMSKKSMQHNVFSVSEIRVAVFCSAALGMDLSAADWIHSS